MYISAHVRILIHKIYHIFRQLKIKWIWNAIFCFIGKFHTHSMSFEPTTSPSPLPILIGEGSVIWTRTHWCILNTIPRMKEMIKYCFYTQTSCTPLLFLFLFIYLLFFFFQISTSTADTSFFFTRFQHLQQGLQKKPQRFINRRKFSTLMNWSLQLFPETNVNSYYMI